MVRDSAHIVQRMHWMKWWPMIVCMVHIICGTHMVHDSTQSTHHFDDEWWVPRTKRQQDSGGSHPFKSIRVLAANKMSFHLHTWQWMWLNDKLIIVFGVSMPGLRCWMTDFNQFSPLKLHKQGTIFPKGFGKPSAFDYSKKQWALI